MCIVLCACAARRGHDEQKARANAINANKMEDLLKRLRSALTLEPPVVDSLFLSSEAIPSNQVTRFENGLPVVAPMDTMDQVQCWLNASSIVTFLLSKINL